MRQGLGAYPGFSTLEPRGVFGPGSFWAGLAGAGDPDVILLCKSAAFVMGAGKESIK